MKSMGLREKHRVAENRTVILETGVFKIEERNCEDDLS